MKTNFRRGRRNARNARMKEESIILETIAEEIAVMAVEEALGNICLGQEAALPSIENELPKCSLESHDRNNSGVCVPPSPPSEDSLLLSSAATKRQTITSSMKNNPMRTMPGGTRSSSTIPWRKPKDCREDCREDDESGIVEDDESGFDTLDLTAKSDGSFGEMDFCTSTIFPHAERETRRKASSSIRMDAHNVKAWLTSAALDVGSILSEALTEMDITRNDYDESSDGSDSLFTRDESHDGSVPLTTSLSTHDESCGGSVPLTTSLSTHDESCGGSIPVTTYDSKKHCPAKKKSCDLEAEMTKGGWLEA